MDEAYTPMADSNAHDGLGKPGETNDGHSYFEWALRAAAIGVAIKNTEAAYKIAKDQKSIADSYQRVAERLRSYYKTTYKPYEDQELKEAMEMKPYDKAPNTVAGRMLATTWAGLTDAAREALVCAPRYCTGNAAAQLGDLYKDMAKARLAAKIRGVRAEDAKFLMLEERRHSFINKALNRGRDILSTASDFGRVSSGVFGQLGGDAARGAAGAMKFLGYSFARDSIPDRPAFVRELETDPLTVGPTAIEPTVPKAPVRRRTPRILG